MFSKEFDPLQQQSADDNPLEDQSAVASDILEVYSQPSMLKVPAIPKESEINPAFRMASDDGSSSADEPLHLLEEALPKKPLILRIKKQPSVLGLNTTNSNPNNSNGVEVAPNNASTNNEGGSDRPSFMVMPSPETASIVGVRPTDVFLGVLPTMLPTVPVAPALSHLPQMYLDVGAITKSDSSANVSEREDNDESEDVRN